MKGKKEFEEKQQELILSLGVIEQQIQQLYQQVQAVERGIIELSSLNIDLEYLVGKKDSEILAPIGRGIFAKAKLLSEELIVDVGGKRFVSKGIHETKKIISEQIKKLEDVKKELNDSIEATSNEAKKIVDDFSEQKNG